MNTFKKLLFTLLTIPVLSSLSASSDVEELTVELSTESNLESLYVSGFQGKDTGLNASYLDELYNILNYDLNYSGYSKVARTSPNHEAILSHEDKKVCFKLDNWKSLNVQHIVKNSIQNKELTVEIFTPKTGSLKKFNAVLLSGNLKEDRCKMHKLADSIVRSIFNKEGAASYRILFSTQSRTQDEAGSWKGEIWECDWDGANAKQITHDGSYCVTPVSIYPARDELRNKFLYVSYKSGQPRIFLAAKDQPKSKKIVELRGNQFLPAVSKDGRKIAFISDASGRADLFIQEFDMSGNSHSKPVQLFSYPRSTQASPTFSPDGSKIAFVSDKDGRPRIYVISSQASSKRSTAILISKQNSENTCPAWSPDGKKLAYSAKTNGVRQIWIYDFESGKETQLTTGSANKENPSWAPNSLHIVYNTTDNDNYELYVVNLNQPEPIKISRGSGKKHYPCWERK